MPGKKGLGYRSCGDYRAIVALLCVCVLSAPFRAQATSPQLASVLPTGGCRGTELEVQFAGDRLQDIEQIIWYEPGLQVLKLNLVTNKVVEAQLRIAPNCRLGEYHLRLRTTTGLSEWRTFLVGPFPVIPEQEPNNDPQKAQPVPLNTTVTGVIPSEDVDCFMVELKQGQRLSAEVEGMRLGRAVFDPHLTVRGPDGAVVADVDDTWLAMQDPFVSLVAPQAGRYVIQLREATYGGNNNCHYRLHVGSFPRPTSVFPLGGQTGELITLKFFSEATGEFPVSMRLPDTPEEKLGVFGQLDNLTAPSPNWIRVSPFPNVLAVPPNQDREHATPTDLTLPLAFNGIISHPGQEDWFRFRAAKSVALEVSVYARRLRSPLDSVVDIFDEKGRSLASNDDAVGADSALKFTPSASGWYFARIRDSLGQGGRDFGYRLEITPVTPSLVVRIPTVARNDTQARQFIAVPRGNRFATLVSVKKSSFRGELAFGIEDLPAGVSMTAERLPANIDAMPLVFEAASDAPLGCKLLDLTARGTNSSGEVVGKFHQDIDLAPGPNNTSYYVTGVDKLCVAVTKEAPFKLRLVEPQVPIVQGGVMRLEIAAERDPGFDAPIQVQLVWNPPGINAQSEAIIPKGATNVFYQLNAGSGAEAHVWKVAFLGHATIDKGAIHVSTQLALLEVAPPFLAGKIEPLLVNPASSGKLVVKLQLLRPFDGKAVVRLMGLPEKIQTVEREVTKDDNEVIFNLAVDPRCPAGVHRNLFCAVELKQSGQVIAQRIAAGGSVRVVLPKRDSVKIAAESARKL